ncbi:hypothetical protein SJDPG2_05660 [Porphyromonas gingivalis SJD2]|nr:hypothetical protein SJDPG2_05660 [Porphyromonas gingivalis SJD2]OWR77163.1 hypothetical protein SJDPG5_06820 [Porphyromonas gingivalis SJD5]
MAAVWKVKTTDEADRYCHPFAFSSVDKVKFIS